MSKLYIVEIASALMAVTLLIADCRHMLTADETSSPQLRTLQMQSLMASQGMDVRQTDVIRQVSSLSVLVSNSRPR